MTRRTKVRLWLTLGGLPFAVAAIWLAASLMNLQTVTARAISYFDGAEYEQSASESGSLAANALVEQWIPYFDRGDAKIGSNDLTGAVDDFEKALELAPADQRCTVGLNLASAWELLGDNYEQAGSHAGAAQLYANAQKVLDSLGDACQQSGQDAEQQEEQQQQRLQQKQAQAQVLDQLSGGQQSGDQLGQLGDKQSQSDQDKQDSQSRDDSPSTPGGVEKPW